MVLGRSRLDHDQKLHLSFWSGAENDYFYPPELLISPHEMIYVL